MEVEAYCDGNYYFLVTLPMEAIHRSDPSCRGIHRTWHLKFVFETLCLYLNFVFEILCFYLCCAYNMTTHFCIHNYHVPFVLP